MIWYIKKPRVTPSKRVAPFSGELLLPTVFGKQKSNDIVGENVVWIRYLSHGIKKNRYLALGTQGSITMVSKLTGTDAAVNH